MMTGDQIDAVLIFYGLTFDEPLDFWSFYKEYEYPYFDIDYHKGLIFGYLTKEDPEIAEAFFEGNFESITPEMLVDAINEAYSVKPSN